MADILTLLALFGGLFFVVQSRAPPEELAERVKGFVQSLLRQDGPSDRGRELWDGSHRGEEDQSAPWPGHAGENRGIRPQSPVFRNDMIWPRRPGMTDDNGAFSDAGTGRDSDWRPSSSPRARRRRGGDALAEEVSSPDEVSSLDEVSGLSAGGCHR